MKTFVLTTFGCQMNLSDSERVKAVCEAMGYQESKSEDKSDLFIINTCSVRQKAEDRVLGMGKKFAKIKNTHPNTKVVITGCMAKRDIRQGFEKSTLHQEKYTGKLQKQMPWVDYVLEINDIVKLPGLLGYEVLDNINDYFAVTPAYDSKFQAFVPISTGCNKFCTFCIVPFTRGKEISRSFEQIYNEVHNLVKKGYKEITLLGQNVNSWRSENSLRTPVTPLLEKQGLSPKTTKDEMDFADLMEKLAQIGGDFWLRFTSSHPYDINPRLIEVMSKYKNIAKQVHFALQSGSNSVLKRMNRFYTRDEFREKVELFRKLIPDISITTDVIVGFSKETEEEFRDTLNLCEELKFDQIFISEYSRREGTIAAKFYEDDIPKDIKRERKEKLDKVLKEGVKENNKKYIGTVQKILVYKTKSKNKLGIFGRTTHFKEVFVENYKHDSQIKVGDFINVKITRANGFGLEGEIY